MGAELESGLWELVGEGDGLQEGAGFGFHMWETVMK